MLTAGRAEHADAVCKPYSKERERLRAADVDATLQLVRLRPRTRALSCTRAHPARAQEPMALTRWAVDLPLASGGDGQSVVEGAAAGGPTIRLELAAPGGAVEALAADEAQLRLLVYELKQAREVMKAACE